jgi:tetratricopeptide (TPR) repeat protein
MGASLINVDAPTDDAVHSHIEQACLIPSSMRKTVLDFCQNRVDYADFLMQYLAYQKRLNWNNEKEMFSMKEGLSLGGEEVFWSHFETIFETISKKSDALEALAVVACCPEPAEQMIVNAVSVSGLQSLLQVGLMRQEERNIFFTFPKIKEGLVDWLKPQISFPQIQEQIALAWMELSERWKFRYDLRIGRAWLLSGDAKKALSFLLLAIRDAREQHRWKLVRSIAPLVEQAALQVDSRVGLAEAKLNMLEVSLAEHSFVDAGIQLEELSQFQTMNQQVMARLAVLRAEFLIGQKNWVEANRELQAAQKIFRNLLDLQGLARAFMRQGYLLFLLNRLESAVDRFSQAMQLSSKDSLDWAESQARLIELRLRLGWTDGLEKQIEHFWKTTQARSNVHHMAYAAYSTGLFLLSQGRQQEGMARLQTSRALAASCGDEELEVQSLENLGWIYFLLEDWTKARQWQRRLVYFYQLRQRRDRRRVAMIRYRVACALAEPRKKLWQMEIQQLEKSFVHVQYWWWIFQMLHPSNQSETIKDYWQKAKAVSQPKIWDLSLCKTLEMMRTKERFVSVATEIQEEVEQRFRENVVFFNKTSKIDSSKI